MQGSFSIGLLEILAYLLPGGLILAFFLEQRAPDLANRTMSEVALQIIFVAASYLVGHLLTLVSLALVKLRGPINWLVSVKPREERLSFYLQLREKLCDRFGYRPPRNDEYLFCLRLVIEFQPHSGQTIDRLYALTLFARNTVAALILAFALTFAANWAFAVAMLGIAIIFFVRYVHLERATADTVFRAAYVYFCSRGEVEGSRSSERPPNTTPAAGA